MEYSKHFNDEIQIDDFEKKVFPLMKQLFIDAFRLDIFYFTFPYKNLESMDHGFRKLVWTEINDQLFDSQSQTLGAYRLLVIKSNLNFYNILAFTTNTKNPSFIATAPVTNKALSDNDILQMFSKSKTSPDFMKKAYNFYHEIPEVSLLGLCSFITHYLEPYIPSFSSVVPEFIDFSSSENNHSIIQNPNTMDNFNTKSAMIYANYLHNYLDYIINGDLSHASSELHKIMDYRKITPKNPIYELKKQATELNILCKGKLLCASVHPFSVLNQFEHFEYQIQTAKSGEDLTNILIHITRKYCLLVKNFNFTSYSYTTRNVINYISAHISEDLSLSIIANFLEKNPSAISNQFSKETGKSVTDMIHELRIKEALHCFNTTDLSVSDVAMKVGVYDFAYFSKLFKKQVGQTPSNYRKMMRRHDV